MIKLYRAFSENRVRDSYNRVRIEWGREGRTQPIAPWSELVQENDPDAFDLLGDCVTEAFTEPELAELTKYLEQVYRIAVEAEPIELPIRTTWIPVSGSCMFPWGWGRIELDPSLGPGLSFPVVGCYPLDAVCKRADVELGIEFASEVLKRMSGPGPHPKVADIVCELVRVHKFRITREVD